MSKRTTHGVSFLVVFLVCFASCDFFIMDREGSRLYLLNNSTYPIGYYFARGDTLTSAYPDTTLPLKNVFIDDRINPGKIQALLIVFSWEKYFDQHLPNDTLSVFVFNADTLNKYTWEEIREGYKVEKRYDLSLDDIEKMNRIITYP